MAVDLSAQRPDYIVAAIASAYGIDADYPFSGTDHDYLFGVTDPVRASELAARLMNEKRRPLRILDIGCGAAGVVLRFLGAGHDVQGVSDIDYRQQPKASPQLKALGDDNYIVGDAHRLADLGLRSHYDLVLSRFTLVHLVDPLAVYQRAASLVVEGGILATDLVFLPEPGPEAYGASDLHADMLQGGFVEIAGCGQPTGGIWRRSGLPGPLALAAAYGPTGSEDFYRKAR